MERGREGNGRWCSSVEEGMIYRASENEMIIKASENETYYKRRNI
jgi:hypothetical protein